MYVTKSGVLPHLLRHGGHEHARRADLMVQKSKTLAVIRPSRPVVVVFPDVIVAGTCNRTCLNRTHSIVHSQGDAATNNKTFQEDSSLL